MPASPRPSPSRTICVIGAGFSGSMVAAHLLGSGPPDLRVVLAERGGAFARGVAYSTDRPVHRLNVAAGRMGAFPDQEADFLRWLRERDPAAATGSFAPRSLYGEYLGDVLTEAERRGPAALERRSDEAVSIEPRGDGALVRFAQSAPVEARRVVLALGNAAPADPIPVASELLRDGRYVPDPWHLGSQPVSNHRPVMLLGTGLTMFDVALDFAARGYRGPMIAVSRRGLIPASHRSPSLPPSGLGAWPELDSWDGTVRALVRLVRARVKREPRGEWREVINSLRPHTARVWRRMPLDQRRRFLERVRPFWESHRHRAPDDVGASIRGLMNSGRLHVGAARLIAISPAGAEVEVRMRPRGQDAVQSLRVAQVVNCTGPQCDYTKVRDALVVDLLERGLIAPDPLRLGLQTAEDGALVGAGGAASGVLFTLGPPRRPDLWESTAVPELRAQARDLAARLAAGL